jgi:4'-phosphopantetheinyl transferase
MNVYWLEQTEEDLPAEDDWLNASEMARLSGMRFPKRRVDWRLGRWTAKRALACYLNLPPRHEALRQIELRAEPSGAPEVFLSNELASVTVSISHRAGAAACAVAAAGDVLGCDLEVIEPRSAAFLADYFTPEEQALVAQVAVADRSQLLALLWSAKESALKALRTGLRLDTRSLAVSLVDARGRVAENPERRLEDQTLSVRSPGNLNSWRPLQVHCESGQTFDGWWRSTGSLLRTLVAAPPVAPPITLEGNR